MSRTRSLYGETPAGGALGSSWQAASPSQTSTFWRPGISPARSSLHQVLVCWRYQLMSCCCGFRGQDLAGVFVLHLFDSLSTLYALMPRVGLIQRSNADLNKLRSDKLDRGPHFQVHAR